MGNAGLPCATTASITGGSSQTSDSPILSDLSGPSPSGEGPVLKKQESLRLDGMSLRDDSASPSQGGTPGPCWRQVPLTQATANADQTGKKLANQQASERRGPHLLSRVLSPTRPCGDSSDSQRYKKDNEQLPRCNCSNCFASCPLPSLRVHPIRVFWELRRLRIEAMQLQQYQIIVFGTRFG